MIAAVIPACNLPELTVRCLAHLHAYGGDGVRAIVVDNGSNHETHRSITAAMGPKDSIIYMGANAGWTKATNVGMRHLETGEYGLCLNNDAFIGPECLDRMKWHLERDQTIGCIGPLTDGPGVNNFLRHRRRIRFAAAAGVMTIDERARIIAMVAPREFAPMGMSPFFCTLFQPWIFERFGLFDEDFANGLGADDLYCRKLRGAGLKVGIAADAFCSHVGAASFKRLGVRRDTNASTRLLRRKLSGGRGR